MECLIDSSLLADYFRLKTPVKVRAQVAQWIRRPDAVLAAPVTYEIQRSVRQHERPRVDAVLGTLPVLEVPENLWEAAMELGRRCVDKGFLPGPVDLLIAAVAVHHGAELVTFDRDYEGIADVCALRVSVLTRAA